MPTPLPSDTPSPLPSASPTPIPSPAPSPVPTAGDTVVAAVTFTMIMEEDPGDVTLGSLDSMKSAVALATGIDQDALKRVEIGTAVVETFPEKEQAGHRRAERTLLQASTGLGNATLSFVWTVQFDVVVGLSAVGASDCHALARLLEESLGGSEFTDALFDEGFDTAVSGVDSWCPTRPPTQAPTHMPTVFDAPFLANLVDNALSATLSAGFFALFATALCVCCCAGGLLGVAYKRDTRRKAKATSSDWLMDIAAISKANRDSEGAEMTMVSEADLEALINGTISGTISETGEYIPAADDEAAEKERAYQLQRAEVKKRYKAALQKRMAAEKGGPRGSGGDGGFGGVGGVGDGDAKFKIDGRLGDFGDVEMSSGGGGGNNGKPLTKLQLRKLELARKKEAVMHLDAAVEAVDLEASTADHKAKGGGRLGDFGDGPGDAAAAAAAASATVLRGGDAMDKAQGGGRLGDLTAPEEEGGGRARLRGPAAGGGWRGAWQGSGGGGEGGGSPRREPSTSF